MTTFISVIYTILTSGTWSNYGSQPEIIKEREGSKRTSVNLGIVLTAMRGHVDQTFDGTTINDAYRGAVEVYARNSSDRDDIMDDIEAILTAGSYSFSIVSKWTENIRNRYSGFYELKILN